MSRNQHIGLSLVLTFWTAAMYAGDEDMSPSAYHVFDPETGYMVTIDPMDEEIVGEQQQDTTLPDAVSTEVEPTTRIAPQVWIAAMIVTIIFATGIVIWSQRNRASQT